MIKKLAILTLLALSTSAFANDELDIADYRLAKEVVAATLEDSRTAVKGLQSIGIGSCEQFWVGKALGMPTPRIVPRIYQGVVVNFETKAALINFAKVANVLGDEVMITNKRGEEIAVPLCAKVVGTVRAGL